jgi:hypothetical protein
MNQKPASFYASPQGALQAPPEEFLYLACLHEGTGVEKLDFLRAGRQPGGVETPRSRELR